MTVVVNPRTGIKQFGGEDRFTAAQRMDMACCEAGYPNAVDDDGRLIDLDLPPRIGHLAWSLATDQGHVSFDEFVRIASRLPFWSAYFDRHGVSYPQVPTDGAA